jgi:predicted methyltransferase
MKKLLALLTLSAAFSLPVSAALAQTYTIPEGTPAHIVRGIQAAERSEEQTARDIGRKPAEVLTLAGLPEGAHIAEISAFGQYYTAILAAAVGPQGRIDMYDMPYMERFGAAESGNNFAAAHANTTYTVVHYNDIDFGSDLDGVYNMMYYHDLQPQEVDTAAMNAKIFAALKPGGIYLIEDHKAEDGSGWRDAGTIHRIGKEVLLEEIAAAGFELVADSDLLANPDDDRSVMVYTPGTRGGTDRAVLVFRKPL